MFYTTGLINRAYGRGHFKIITVYGQSGLGKSVYAWKLMQEVYPDMPMEELKHYIIFTPEDLIAFAKKLRKDDIRIKTFLLDDAGIWFNNQDYKDPFVQGATKFFQVMRTNCASVILTTPRLSALVASIRNSDMYTVKVVDHIGDNRYAKTYQQSSGFGNRTWVKLLAVDSFKAILDDELYNWYIDMRKKYVEAAIDMMESGLKERQSRLDYWKEKYAKRE